MITLAQSGCWETKPCIHKNNITFGSNNSEKNSKGAVVVDDAEAFTKAFLAAAAAGMEGVHETQSISSSTTGTP